MKTSFRCATVAALALIGLAASAAADTASAVVSKPFPNIVFILVHQPSFPGKDFKGKTKAGPHGDFIFEFDAIVNMRKDYGHDGARPTL